MFFGEYEYTVDQKGRIAIPPKFREDFRGGIVLLRGLDNCINACTAADWKKRAEEMAGQSMNQSKARRMNRALFSSAFSLDIDGQGRVALPAKLRQYAGITSEVVVAGIGDYLEIWSRTDWQAEQELMSEQLWQIAESTEDRM